MEIQTSSSPRPSSNTLGWNCRSHFRVAARRQTAANISPLFQSAALCRDAATANNLKLFADVPAITPLGTRTMQKSLISRSLPHSPTSSAFTPKGEGGIKSRILYSPASPCVGICRNMSEYFIFFQAAGGQGMLRGAFCVFRQPIPNTHHAIASRSPANFPPFPAYREKLFSPNRQNVKNRACKATDPCLGSRLFLQRRRKRRAAHNPGCRHHS